MEIVTEAGADTKEQKESYIARKTEHTDNSLSYRGDEPPIIYTLHRL
jgi:hypothetical protein